MQLAELIEQIKRLKAAYNALNRMEGYKTWGAAEYLHALQGDVGDFGKLYLAKKGFAFSQKDLDRKIAQELADILWDVLVLADELDVDLEDEMEKTLNKLGQKIADRKIVK